MMTKGGATSSPSEVHVGEAFRRVPPHQNEIWVRIEDTYDQYSKVNAQRQVGGQTIRIWVDPSAMLKLSMSDT